MKRDGVTKCEQAILVYLSSRFGKRKTKKTQPIDILPVKSELKGLGYSLNSRGKVNKAITRLKELKLIEIISSINDLPDPWRTIYINLEDEKQAAKMKEWLSTKKAKKTLKEKEADAFLSKMETINRIMDQIKKTNDVELYNFYFGENGKGLYNIRNNELRPNELRIAKVVNELTEKGVFWNNDTTWIIPTKEGIQLGKALKPIFALKQ